MAEEIQLLVESRDLLGKQVKQLRAQGKTPAVIHNHGDKSIHVAVDELTLKKAYSRAGKNHPVSIKVGDKNFTTLIKEVSYAPATDNIYHTVFQAVKANEKTSAEVPLHLVGDSPAEKASLQIIKQLDHLEVEALPRNLPDSFEVDISTLIEAGDKINVSDIKPPEGVEIKTDPTNLIAIVEIPKDQIAEADAALKEQEEQDASKVESEEGGDDTESTPEESSEEKTEKTENSSDNKPEE